MEITGRARGLGAAVLATLVLAGCGNIYSRDDFVSSVMGKSENEVVEKVGKPASINAVDPAHPEWIYRHETFDTGNRNRVDANAIVTFERSGFELKVARVSFE